MIRVNKGFQGPGSVSYATTASRKLLEGEALLDCSLGVNPYGISRRVLDHLKDFDEALIHHYPKSTDPLKKVLVDYWARVTPLDSDQVYFAQGAMGALEMINKVLVAEGTRVLGVCPQFTDYAFDVGKCGGEYACVPLNPLKNHAFEPEVFLEAVTEDVDLIYIDNPNNPTGQIVAKEDIGAIVEKASRLDIPVVMDEAYGDYMTDLNSAVSLIQDYDNLLVVRSFSKAFGMAGLRVGYVVVPRALARVFEGVAIPFPLNSVGVYFTEFILEDREFVRRSARRISRSKQRIIGTLRKLKVMQTHDELPIMTLTAPGKDFDLYRAFLEEGVLTSSGEPYEGLSKNSVRVRVPRNLQPLLAAIEKIESLIVE
jgi:histidinol-phosphate aminotransferase